jgi:Bacterial transcriptional activator domain
LPTTRCTSRQAPDPLPAEALMIYDRLRCTLRDELGVAAGPLTQAGYRRLLGIT